MVQLAQEFMNKIGRGGDMEDLEKVEYWLYQGSGQLCDGCKVWPPDWCSTESHGW